MGSLITQKDCQDSAKLVMSLAKAALIVPAGVILSCALFLGFLATLVGLSPVEVAFNFIIDAVGPWLATTVSFLIIPYFLAAILSPTVGTPERREKTFDLWHRQTLVFTVIAVVAAILASLSASAKLVKAKPSFVAGLSPLRL